MSTSQTFATCALHTLEGCVRISDIIAYLGKDRQDAARIKLLDTGDYDESPPWAKLNHQIIQNITRNIIKNSLGHDYLAMDEEVFAAVDAMRGELREDLQERRGLQGRITFVRPMMERMFTTFVDDIRMGREESPYSGIISTSPCCVPYRSSSSSSRGHRGGITSPP